MLSFDQRDEDVFFDSKDCLLSEDSDVGVGELVYDIWVDELLSVRERRGSFMRQMGLTELAPPEHGVERVMECSGAESSSLGLFADGEEGNLVCCRREVNCGANSMVDELDRDVALDGEEDTEFTLSTQDCETREADANLEECDVLSVNKKKVKSWWKRLSMKKKGRGLEARKSIFETSKFRRVKVKHNSKKRKELTALYTGQEIRAHKGLIWTMKFSPDGQYLASGGEDGIVRIWHVTSANASSQHFLADDSLNGKVKPSKLDSGRNSSTHSSVVIPDKVFQLKETPLQELHGHTSDVLDLAWSNSNNLISSSKDGTVRLWQVGCDQCLNVFRHNNYVTCVQFNPVDENFFTSGSIDGIVRIWGISEKRVVDWADARDVITAICYHPDGKSFVAGSIEGTCRFYDASGAHIQLDTQVNIQGRKKNSSKITSIQFSQDEYSRRLMIASEDSKLRIYDKTDIIYKYKGLAKSGSQMSASFTSTGKHIISVGEDSRVYVWDYDGSSSPSSKHKKSERSCEHFLSEGVSVAIPWSGSGMGQRSLSNGTLEAQDHLETTSWIRDSERFSLGNWFSIDGPCRGSATWPEEKLHGHYFSYQDLPCQQPGKGSFVALPETWGLVVVTAGWDGTIRTFHNYGLPVRL